MSEKCAVFSCQGLGDGLIALVLSQNLFLSGKEVTTFHPFLHGMQSWVSHLPIESFPNGVEEALSQYDRFFIIYEKSPWMQKILTYCLEKRRAQTTVLNPIATLNQDYPFWEEGKFKGDRSFVENLQTFCKEVLGFAQVTAGNGIRPPDGVVVNRYPHRVVIHPTSSREGKNWPREKYALLAKLLVENGFSPLFLLSLEEKGNWSDVPFETRLFHSPAELAELVSESGYMIGNDSGIGHLASCLKIPTVTVCRSFQSARFWRPGWAPGKVVTPSTWIPNCKGLRWRDRYWKRWVSVDRVFAAFLTLSGRNPSPPG